MTMPPIAPLRSRLGSLRIDPQLAHLGLQRSALHAEFGGGAGFPSDLSSGIVEGALDGLPLGDLEGDDGGPQRTAIELAHRDLERAAGGTNHRALTEFLNF